MDEGVILVVDDQALMVNLVSAVLQLSGYEVKGTEDPKDAIAAAAAPGATVLLLVTDMRMLQMDGREVAERVRRHCPDLPVLFMSGDTPEEFGFVADGRNQFLRKPFRNQELVDRVRSLLDSRPAPE